MVTKLFKSLKPNADKRVWKHWGEKSEFMSPAVCYNPKDCVRDLCPNFLCSCGPLKSNRRERAFERARDELEKEINIIENIK